MPSPRSTRRQRVNRAVGRPQRVDAFAAAIFRTVSYGSDAILQFVALDLRKMGLLLRCSLFCMVRLAEHGTCTHPMSGSASQAMRSDFVGGAIRGYRKT